MATFAEILKAKGIDEDIIKAVQAEMKENKIFMASEENLDIRYGKLKTDHDGVKGQLDEANKLIEDLKKSAKGNEDLQGKISSYESQIADLQAQMIQQQIDAAVKIGLMNAKAVDIDYLTFKLKEKGSLELDESGKIKGWDDKLAALKTQIPSQFEGTGQKAFQEHKLPDQQEHDSISKEAFQRMGYQDRLKLYSENPEAYKELTN